VDELPDAQPLINDQRPLAQQKLAAAKTRQQPTYCEDADHSELDSTKRTGRSLGVPVSSFGLPSSISHAQPTRRKI